MGPAFINYIHMHCRTNRAHPTFNLTIFYYADRIYPALYSHTIKCRPSPVEWSTPRRSSTLLPSWDPLSGPISALVPHLRSVYAQDLPNGK